MLRQINPLDDSLTPDVAMALVRLLGKYKQYKQQHRYLEAQGVGTAAILVWRTIKKEPMNQTGFGGLEA